MVCTEMIFKFGGWEIIFSLIGTKYSVKIYHSNLVLSELLPNYVHNPTLETALIVLSENRKRICFESGMSSSSYNNPFSVNSEDWKNYYEGYKTIGL